MIVVVVSVLSCGYSIDCEQTNPPKENDMEL